jgi:PAS domain S-box-containing protein
MSDSKPSPALATEALFPLLVESVKDYAIFVLDPQGRVKTWNAGAQRIKGYRAEEIIGRHFSAFYTQDAIDRRWPWEELELAVEHGRFEDEGWRLRKDGSRFWANVVITPLYYGGSLVGFAKVTRDLSERGRVLALEAAERASRELLELERRARAESERSGRMKDEFLATLSHELRTPLNAILGWAQILQRDPGLPASAQGAVEKILRNAQSQAHIIGDLLDMSSILAGKIRLDQRPLYLPDVVTAAIDTVRPAAQAKGIRLHVALEPLAGLVRGDADRLQQLAWNLLSNAVKFTPPGGSVDVTLRVVGEDVELRVRDSGVGIAPDFLPHVFDRFTQSDASIRRRVGGLGLGLALVKELAELHGGRVGVASEGEGRGATFTVRLPLAAPAQPDVPGGPPASHLPSLDGLHVLVVDDEEDTRELLRQILAPLGAVVILADSGEAALRMVESERPDVMLSDIGMPGIDGYDLLARLHARGVDVPAATITAYAREEDRVRAVESGYRAHIAKPLEMEAVVRLVAQLAGRSEPEAAHH